MGRYGATSEPPLVSAVPVNTYEGPSTGGAVLYDKYDEKGQGDDRPYRDVLFGVLFVLQLAAVIATDVLLMKKSSLSSSSSSPLAPLFNASSPVNGGSETESHQNDDDDDDDDDFFTRDPSDMDALSLAVRRNLMYLVLPALVLAIVLTNIITTCVIPSNPRQAVGSTLIGSVVVNIFMVIYTVMMAPAAIWASVMLLVMAGLQICYVCHVWRLVPFAAANVKVALQAVNHNGGGLYAVALLLSALGFVWVVGWTHLFVLVTLAAMAEPDDADSSCPGGNGCHEDGTAGAIMSPAILFFLLVSLYWTVNVFANAVQTTVAGVVGRWLLDTTDSSGDGCCCCTAAVWASTVATFTTSLGSVCLGSLLEAIISALRQMAEFAAEQNRRSRNPDRRDDTTEVCITFLGCIAACILACLESIIDYFNQWAYVYVGLYGTSYLESGKMVWELFQERGWTAILTSDISGSVLAFTTVTVSVLCGFMGMIVENTLSTNESFLFGGISRQNYATGWIAFGLALVLGLWTAGCMMNVVRGAIKAVIVCFVESPRPLQEKHPELAYELSSSWAQAFPSLGIEILPVASPVKSGGLPVHTGTTNLVV